MAARFVIFVVSPRGLVIRTIFVFVPPTLVSVPSSGLRVGRAMCIRLPIVAITSLSMLPTTFAVYIIGSWAAFAFPLPILSPVWLLVKPPPLCPPVAIMVFLIRSQVSGFSCPLLSSSFSRIVLFLPLQCRIMTIRTLNDILQKSSIRLRSTSCRSRAFC